MYQKEQIKGIIQGLLTTTISVVICLVAAEALLRFKNDDMKSYDIEMWRYAKELKTMSSNPILGHEHVPSSEAILQSVNIRTNNLGLRGGDLDTPAQKTRRILFLGSSITLGWGVEEEKTLTAVLQDRFNQQGQHIEVLNAGIGNYNAVRYIERFLTKLEQVKPTDIVLHYFINDAEKLTAGGGNYLLQNSQLAVTLWIASNRVFNKSGESSLIDHYKEVYAEDSQGRKEMELALTKIKDYAAKNNIRVFFAMTPDVHNLKNYPFSFVHNEMKKLAHSNGFKYVDLLPAFHDLDPKDVWAMPGDPHPNALGHKRMADYIYPILNSI